MKRILLAILFLFSINSMVVAQNSGNSLEDIKARTKLRLPAIKQMKSSGAVGENNKGFLEVLIETKADKKVIVDENKDRSRVYTTIAKQTKTSTTEVASRRVTKIREIADSGDMYQDDSGKWIKKK